jgi:hypothetical protein
MSGPSKRQQALLVQLADGRLHGRRRARAEARLAGVVDLERALARQRRVTEALRGGPVPQDAALALPVVTSPSRVRPRALRLPAVTAALAAAAVIAALVLGSQPTSPSVASAAGLGMLPTERAAPPRLAEAPLLAGGLEGVAFPDWDGVFGWRANGSRDDVIDGRDTRTVFYEHMGHRIGYTIVAGGTLELPEGAEIVRRNGVEIALFRDGPRDIAIFVRDGLTCILSGEVMDRATLVKLAAWHADGAIEF